MNKINIGAGYNWYCEGWETLDNAPISKKLLKYQNYGKCWDSKLKTDYYDILFTSHTLEHIPHFRLEKTISEFNRILKKGGLIRIAVPSMKKAAKAYLDNNISFFNKSKHYSNHMGIGASFLRILISPGGQTLAFSREMDEFIGGYAHTYAFDYKMLKIVLEKWGFEMVRECNPGDSKIKEMKKLQFVNCNGKEYLTTSKFFKEEKFLNQEYFISGFDKNLKSQLIIEAVKKRNVNYSFNKEFDHNKLGRDESFLNLFKLKCFKLVNILIDRSYQISKVVKLNKLIKFLIKK